MEEMVREASNSEQDKPWLLAAELFCFTTVAGARMLSNVLPAPVERTAEATQTPSPLSALPGLPGLLGEQATVTPAAPLATPTPACVGASLTIGTTQFQVQSFAPVARKLAAPGGLQGQVLLVIPTQAAACSGLSASSGTVQARRSQAESLAANSSGGGGAGRPRPASPTGPA